MIQEAKEEQRFVGFTCRNFSLCGYQVDNNKHAIWPLLLSLLALITTFQQQMAILYNLVMPNKIVLP